LSEKGGLNPVDGESPIIVYSFGAQKKLKPEPLTNNK